MQTPWYYFQIMYRKWVFFHWNERKQMLLQFIKNDKQSQANYLPISLLPIHEKNFLTSVIQRDVLFFITNHLISAEQSGLCQSFLISYPGYEVWDVFLDISKTFDKVWHGYHIFNVKQNGISSKLLRLIKDSLIDSKQDNKQLVDLNRQCSSWMGIQTGEPQGSI